MRPLGSPAQAKCLPAHGQPSETPDPSGQGTHRWVSALNIIFAKSLEDMGFDMTKLVPSDQAFYGIIPGASSTPVGKVTLPVTFGTRDNYRTESIIFEVAPFETSYHNILGRPTLAKFMAIPNNTYLPLKMPAPNGVLSIRGDI
ncbi:uncharacterized protein LOC120684707 [Panicum virgatum]|uniref:uncharacterized protein LOC120684707 n=1 Tax=Panicum virgatum TaxID=38727 RepID=UPI0019D50252|nr:uncharacterized protein LOC120684707 [Panicum virgatum]